MPRKPNYSFERSQRAKCKAAKKAERLQAKAEKSAAKKETPDETGTQEAGVADTADDPHPTGVVR